MSSPSPSTTDLKPAQNYLPPLNSIPDDLLPRFDPNFARYFTAYQAGRLATHQIPIASFRANPRKYIVSFGSAVLPNTGVGAITEQQCPTSSGGSIEVRIYEPKEKHDEPRPAYINFHGGGWVFGDMSVDAEFCKRVVDQTGAVVFDVDYRLAPEFPYPTPVEDCWDAFQWVVQQKQQEFNLDLDRVAVGGPSAGGHLSAIVAQRARDTGLKLRFQQLTVPVVDMDQFDEQGNLRADVPYASYKELGHTVTLNRERMEYFAKHFLGVPRHPDTYNNPSISPIRAPSLANLAPAIILTAEMDPLRDEGAAYAEKLRAAGNEVEYHCIKGLPHTMALLDDICEPAREYHGLLMRALKRALKRALA